MLKSPIVSNGLTNERSRGVAPLVRPTIPIRYLTELVRRSAATAAAISRAAAAGSIPRAALGLPRLRVSVLQLERFYAALRRETQDELFGYFARPVPPGSYATLARLLTGSVDLGCALENGFRFYRLFDRHAYWRLEAEGRQATLSVTPRDRDRDQAGSIFFVQAMLLSPWRMAVWLGGRPIPLDEVRLPRRFSQFAAETRHLFGREPSFGRGPASLRFASECLSWRVVRAPGDADAYAKASLRDQLLAPAQATFESELRALLADATPLADVSLEHAARRLGLSRASLTRKLAQRGLSFQRLKDDLRRDHAIALLTGSSQSIAEIAERVGYSAPSAFQRAFREWTGVSPGRLRRR
jgi:AraC-like DNA-binding protein